jgi:membrane-associated PAP2 superfamily phosphatase
LWTFDQILFLFKSLGLEFVVLSLWCALFDERPGLSFVRVRVTLRLTVYLGVEPTLWTFDQILFPFQELGSGMCCAALWGALSDEKPGLSFVRLRVTLRLTVYLGVEPTLWTLDQILFPFQELGSGMCCAVSVGRPL